MPLIFDLTETFSEPDQLVPSGTLGLWAASQAMFEIFGDPGIEISGSWFGSGFNYGATVVFDLSTQNSGTWHGLNSNWAATGVQLENHDKTQVVSNSAPNISEGLNSGEYNPFPYPPEVVEEETGTRDATRFAKSYSFNRHQPVHVRIFRR